MHSQYGNTVKMVNVQEGQQHIITPQTASQLGFTGQDVASHFTIPQGPDVHR